MIAAAAIVPHAPLLTIYSSSGDPMHAPIAEVLDALEELTFDGCDAVVLLSPHGGATGVYSNVRGSLDGFGLGGVESEVASDGDLAADIAGAWDYPVLEGPADHGITGALLLGHFPHVPVVAVTFAGVTGPAAAAGTANVVEAARRLATALQGVAAARKLAVVASAHTSAALSPGAPLMDRAEGHELDSRILDALGTDAGALADIKPDLWEAAGSCGAAPLTALGLMCAGARAEVLAYAAPAGVGYLVARVGLG